MVRDPRIGYERVEVREDGTLLGERLWRVTTGDPIAALLAVGVPRYRDRWSEAYPDLRVSRLATELLGGRDASPQEGGAHTLVRVEYTSRPIVILPQQPGESYTEVSTYDASLTVYATIDGRSIAAGRGAPKDEGGLGAIVHVVRSAGDNVLPVIAAARAAPVNSLALTLPPLLGGSAPIALLAGQARYTGLSGAEPIPGGRIRYSHALRIAPDHLVRWRREDAAGNPTGPMESGEIYERSDIGVLWL